LHEVLLVGYCLMFDHVQLVSLSPVVERLALSIKHTHGRYASYWNMVHNSSGHAWQRRYYACPLDRPHLWEALRYTELNPVRAKLVTEATPVPEFVPPPSSSPRRKSHLYDNATSSMGSPSCLPATEARYDWMRF
jgi:hypothetical protein